MFKINERVVSENQIISEPQVFIQGNSSDGSRRIVVNFDVTDEEGHPLKVISHTYSGMDFNEVYAIYTSDKSLLERVAQDEPLLSEILETMPDDLMNEEES